MDEQDRLAALLDEMREQSLSVQRGGSPIDTIPTGIHTFDLSTGIGGVPRRRVCVFQGEEASGKTLLLLVLIANVQKGGGRAAFIDLEHALTPSFASLVGVAYDDLVLSEPRTLDEAYDVAREFCQSGLFDVVGFDSAVALATREELDLPAGSSRARAAQARLHSEELRKINAVLHARTAFVIVNQLRENPNPPKWWRGGKMLYSPGGKAIKFYSSMTVNVKIGKTYTKNHERIGHETKTQIIKNKMSQPYRRATFDLMYHHGIDATADLISNAIHEGVIAKKSSWFYFDKIDPETMEVIDELKWNGREAVDEAFEDTDLLQNLALQMEQSQGEQTLRKSDGGWDEV